MYAILVSFEIINIIYVFSINFYAKKKQGKCSLFGQNANQLFDRLFRTAQA